MPNALIIDSEPAVAQALKDALAARGVDSHLTSDGTDGLEYVKTNKPDLIVLCVELTRGSGYSVCNKLKKDPGMAAIPLILTSSQATEETFEQHKKLRTRAEAYIKKPYTTEEILKTVGEYVKLAAAATGHDEVEVSIDELEVEIPNIAPKRAPVAAAAPLADDEEFLDVTFEGEDVNPDRPAPRDTQVHARPLPVTLASVSAEMTESPAVFRAAPPTAAVEAPRSKAAVQGDAELERLRNEVKTLRGRVQRLEQEAQEKEVAFNDRLLAESARARDSLESKKKLTQIEREVAKYQAAAAKAEAEAEAARQALREAQSQTESAGSERGALTDKIAQLVDKVKELAAERDSLQRELSELQQSQKSAMSGVETADKMREKAKKAVDIAMQLLEETRLAH